MADSWAVVTEAFALAQAGADASVFRTEMVTYAVGSADMVLVIEPGDRPGGTGVQDFEHVTLYPPFPDAVENCFEAAPGADRLLLGFVRIADGCVALGPLHVGMRGYTQADATAPSRLTEARLSLRERMSFSLLDRVRPTASAPAPDLAWLDLARADPSRALRLFVDAWFADIPPATDLVESAPVPVPAALMELYRAAAGRPEVLGPHNRIHPAASLQRDENSGMVEFGEECQGCFWLLMDPAEEDPRVWYGGRDDDLIAERERLSAFLLQFVLAEQSYAGRFGGFANLDRAKAREFVAPLRRVPLQPMRWPVDRTFQYAGADGFLALVAVHGDDVELYVGARHRSALHGIREPEFDWFHFTG